MNFVTTLLLLAFAAVSLLLAAIGVYDTVAYTVARGTFAGFRSVSEITAEDELRAYVGICFLLAPARSAVSMRRTVFCGAPGAHLHAITRWICRRKCASSP